MFTNFSQIQFVFFVKKFETKKWFDIWFDKNEVIFLLFVIYSTFLISNKDDFKQNLKLYNLSIKAPVCQWVSVFVGLFPNSSETANPSELKFWGMISLGMEKVLG